MVRVTLYEGELPSLDALAGEVMTREAGAVASFSGVVKPRGGAVQAMRFPHREDVAERLKQALSEARSRFELLGAVLAHRLGTVPAGGEILRLVCAARRRGELFEALAFIVDRIKGIHAGWAEELAP